MEPLTKSAQILLELAGGSITELAMIADVKPPSVSDWLNGKTKSLKSKPAARMAERFNLNVAWVAEGRGEMYRSIRDDADRNMRLEHVATSIPSKEDYATIPQLHANGSCGDGYLNDHVEVRGSMAFKRDWLARMSIDPEQAGVIYAKGDSMMPTINDGEVLLVDYRQKEPMSSRIYVLNTDGDLRVKRLFKRNGWLITSDNQDKLRYPDELIDSPTGMVVVGRVVWRGGGL